MFKRAMAVLFVCVVFVFSGCTSGKEEAVNWELYYRTDDYESFMLPEALNVLDGSMVKVGGKIQAVKVDSGYYYTITEKGKTWIVSSMAHHERLPVELNDYIVAYGIYAGTPRDGNDIPVLHLLRMKYGREDYTASLEDFVIAEIFEGRSFEDIHSDFRMISFETGYADVLDSLKDLVRNRLAYGERLVDVMLADDEVIVTIDIEADAEAEDFDSYAMDELIAARTGEIANDLLGLTYLDFLWNVITVDFGEFGSITDNKSTIIPDEEGNSFFYPDSFVIVKPEEIIIGLNDGEGPATLGLTLDDLVKRVNNNLSGMSAKMRVANSWNGSSLSVVLEVNPYNIITVWTEEETKEIVRVLLVSGGEGEAFAEINAVSAMLSLINAMDITVAKEKSGEFLSELLESETAVIRDGVSFMMTEVENIGLLMTIVPE